MAERAVAVDGRWPALARAFETTAVVVVGDVMLDRTVEGQARRLSPEAPVPVLLAEEERTGLGGAGNVARNLASLGARVRLCCVIGADAEGARVRERCRDASIETSGLLEDRARPTAVKTRFVAHGQQMLRVDREQAGAPAGPVEEELIRQIEAANADALILSDYGKGVLTERVIVAALALARRTGAPCVVDPKGARFERYAGCTVITPNTEEAAAASGLSVGTDAEAATAGRRLLALAGCEAVAVTRGRHGVTLVTPARVWHLTAHAREVFDVAGAGDTLVAAFALALACGAALPEAAALGNVAAGLVVQSRGIATTTREALGAALAAEERAADVGRSAA